MKKIIYIFLFFSVLNLSAQEQEAKLDSVKTEQKAKLIDFSNQVAALIDTIRVDTTLIGGEQIALIDYANASEFDKKWMAAWENNQSDSTLIVTPQDTATNHVITNFSTKVLKERLALLDSNTPFHVEYNPSLEKIIKHYLKNRPETLANLMGKAKYYFPMFESYLDKYDMPLELKYLAVVESALRPNAKSRVGAKGLWQFMYGTGKEHGLNVSSYVDERSDPIKATEAACQYLTRLYKIFNDWDLALAAYNSGPGNVNKAIRRSGGRKNYWNIRHHLPRETAGYLPAFYATYYIFEYAEEHNLHPKNELLPFFQTDTVEVKRQLTFEQINRVLGTDDELLEFLNPQYKLNIIPKVKNRTYSLKIPKYLMGKFVSNEDQIYAFAEADDKKREKPYPKYFEANDKIRYRVRSGDYLGKIAIRYGVTVKQIKRWNGLKSNNLRVGQRLTIYPRKPVASSSKKPTKKSAKKKTAPVNPNKKYTTYVVKEGDSLWLISQKYPKVTVNQLKSWNNIWSNKLKPGTKLKIY